MIEIKQQLLKFSDELQNCNDKLTINNLAQELVTSILDAEFSSVWYYDAKRFVLLREREERCVREIPLKEKKGILYKCFMTQESSLYNYLASDKDYVASIDNPDNIKIKSKIMVPLLDGDRFVGIVTAYNSIKHSKKFTKVDVQTLEHITPYIIQAIYKMHHPELLGYSAQTIIDEKIIEESSVEDEPKTTDETLTFVANFVHDIRTPANSLYGFLDLLEGQITDPRLKSYIENAKESAEFINELTTSVLNLVSTHKESTVSQVEEVDTVRFFSTIANSFSSNMYEKKIQYNIYIDPMLPKQIKIDTLKMKRVVLNLIGNAYKFTPNGKSIEFSVRYVAKTNRIVMYVKDTGIGIPKEKQKDIFEAFKQAEETTALNYGGSGLGLFISAKYVQELGGKLSLISDVDRGSTFSFDIPVNSVDATPSISPIKHKHMKIAIVMQGGNSFVANNIARYIIRLSDIEKEMIVPVNSLEKVDESFTHAVVFQNKLNRTYFQQLLSRGVEVAVVEEELFYFNENNKPKNATILPQYSFYLKQLYQFLAHKKEAKVLIVDDDFVSVSLIENILENELCSVDTTTNPKEAIQKVFEAYQSEQPYDLMYIDNKMPYMSGSEVVAMIREYEQLNKLKPLYIVSTSGDELATQEEREKYDMYLGKPFKKEQVVEALVFLTKE